MDWKAMQALASISSLSLNEFNLRQVLKRPEAPSNILGKPQLVPSQLTEI